LLQILFRVCSTRKPARIVGTSVIVSVIEAAKAENRSERTQADEKN